MSGERRGSGPLPGPLAERLQEALLHAFPSRADLEQFTYHKLDIKLNEVARSHADLRETVSSLLSWADSQGMVENLIRKAKAERPNNPTLAAVADEMEPVHGSPMMWSGNREGFSPATPPARVAASEARRPGAFSYVAMLEKNAALSKVPENVYAVDENDAAARRAEEAFVVVQYPNEQWLRSANFDEHVVVSALCLCDPEAFLTTMAQRLGDVASELRLKPTDMPKSLKERVAVAIASALRRSFISSIVVSKEILVPKGKVASVSEIPYLLYRISINSLLSPIFQMHQTQNVTTMRVRISQSGEHSRELLRVVKATKSAAFGRRGDVDFAGQGESELLAKVADFAYYSVGQLYNKQDASLVELLSRR